ncbi:MAG: transporter substrate-binding domain-containing protein [Candidatus Nitronauta litoralis]|uniref:Transporter substrate-binding domain-containing protein n=1 Tax=Candidatus Nitronauta litoralis TaxID=2705533 RepID=A0A7T0BV19_9BACT|nr:MAG: transporter substrate-binding domain-containing protein [Candidatus Nitronauta litoralis]
MKFFCRGLSIIFVMFMLSACADTNQTPKYKVGIDATLIPMAYVNDQNKLEGFEIELLDAIAKTAGFEYETINVAWAGIISGVVTHKFDMSISSITILEERKKNMAFSTPYLRSGLAIVVRRDDERIKSLQDLKEGKMKVGAQRGTTSYFFLEKHPEIEKIAYEKYNHAVADMIKGEIDAVLGESTGTLYYKNHDNEIFQKIKMVEEVLTEEYYGIIMAPDNKELKTTLDKAIKTLIKNGTIERLHEKWELGLAASVPELK